MQQKNDFNMNVELIKQQLALQKSESEANFKILANSVKACFNDIAARNELVRNEKLDN